MADDAPPPKKKKKLLKKTDGAADGAAAAEESSEGGGGGGKKGLIIMVAVGLLMMGVGVGVGIGVSGMLGGDDPAKADIASEGAEGADAEVLEEEEEIPESERHSIYVSVGKLLATVESKGATRYIQAEVDLVGYDKNVTDAAMHDMPAIRNRLLMLFGSQNFEDVKSIEGREKLRAASVEAVNEVLGLTKRKNKIEDAYFTAFVLQ